MNSLRRYFSAYHFCFVVSLLLLLVIGAAVFPARNDAANIKRAKANVPVLAQSTNPSIVGQWSSLIQFRTVPVHISLLPNGKILYWGRDKVTNPNNGNVEDVGGHSNTYLVDPAFFFNDPLGHTVTYPNSTTNLFCSGHSFLPDGRLLVTGGHDKSEKEPKAEGLGERAINIFDYRNSSNPWRKLGITLAQGRWYPYNVTLANGNVAILGGYYWANPGTSRLPSDPETPYSSLNTNPERYTFNPNGDGAVVSLTQDQNSYTEIETYPLVHLLFDGQILVPGPRTRLFDANDPNPTNPVGHFLNYPLPNSIPQTPGQTQILGSSIQYDPDNGKVIVIGGSPGIGGVSLNTAVVTNYSSPDKSWQYVGSMNFKRKHHTATILPDGKVLVTGGTQCPGTNDIICSPDFPNPNSGAAVVNPELWDPNTPSAWTTLARSSSGAPRVYHSIALLLPDATVLVGGGGLPGAFGEVDPLSNEGRAFGHTDAEIFSPPYLFDASGQPATRPVINWVQASTVGLGQRMKVGTSSPQAISSVVLVRLGSVTHGSNQDQRRVPLAFSVDSNSPSDRLSITLPATGNLCPPGPYMLFVLNSNGTPSVAKIITVLNDPQSLPAEPQVPSPISKSKPAVAANLDGRLQVFYRGGDDALYTFAQVSAGSSTWTAPLNLGGHIVDDPVVIRGASGLLEVFVVGSDNAIYANQQTLPNSGTWTGFYSLGGSLKSIPAVYPNADGRLQLFYRGSNDLLFTLVQAAVGSRQWSSHQSLGDGITAEPGVGRNADGRLAVFVKRLDNSVYFTMQTNANTNTWSALVSLGGYSRGAPVVSRNSDGRLEVFVLGLRSIPTFPLPKTSDNPVHHIQQTSPNSSQWTPWSMIGGSIIFTPSVATNADGRLELYAIGNDHALYTNRQTAPTIWAGYTFQGGYINASAAAALNSDGRLGVFVRGADNAFYYNLQTSPGSTTYAGFSRVVPAN